MTRGIAFRRCIGYIHRHYGKEDLAAEPPGDNRKEGRRDRRCTDVSKCTCTSLSPSPCTQVCETREIRGCCRKYVFCRSNLGRHVLFFAQFQSRYCSHFDGGLCCFCVSVYMLMFVLARPSSSIDRHGKPPPPPPPRSRPRARADRPVPSLEQP